jgi:hypothetical protein
MLIGGICRNCRFCCLLRLGGQTNLFGYQIDIFVVFDSDVCICTDGMVSGGDDASDT